MANIDSIVLDIDISPGSSPVTRAGFGVGMLASSNLLVGFTEDTRTYTSQQSVEDDADVDTNTAAITNVYFAQSPAPNQIVIGNRESDEFQEVEFTVTGAADGTYTITINGEDHDFVASSSTVSAIVAGLVSAINGGGQTALVTATDNDPIVTVTSDVLGEPFTFASSSTGDPITENETQPNVNVQTELNKILADNNNWYGLLLDTRDDTDISRAAAFAESAKRLFYGQTSSADMITSATTDIASDLQSQSLQQTHVDYYSDDTEFFDAGQMALILAADFDANAPTASYRQVALVPVDDTLTDTAIANLRSKNAGFYSTFKGVPSTANGVKVAAGFLVEHVITINWLEARIGENIAQLFLDAAARSERIPFDDSGFQRIDSQILSQLKIGETIGHFTDGTSQVLGTLRADVAPADVATGTYRVEFGTRFSGTVLVVDIDGTVSTDFESLTV